LEVTYFAVRYSIQAFSQAETRLQVVSDETGLLNYGVLLVAHEDWALFTATHTSWSYKQDESWVTECTNSIVATETPERTGHATIRETIPAHFNRTASQRQTFITNSNHRAIRTVTKTICIGYVSRRA